MVERMRALMLPGVLAAVAASASGHPSVARAGEGEAARALVGTALLEQLIRARLPAVVPLPARAGGGGGSASVIEARLCAPDKGGRGHVLTVLVTGAPSGRPGAGSLRPSEDCQASLDAVAQRLLPAVGAPAVAVADLAIAFRPGEIRFSIEKTAVAAEKGAAAAETLRALGSKTALPAAPLADLKVPMDSGPPLVLGVGLDWRREGVGVAVALGGTAGRPGGRADLASAVPGTSLCAELPLTFVSALLAAVQRRGPFEVRLDSEIVEVTDVRVTAQGAGLQVTGMATPRSVRQPLRVAADLAGEDLQIAEVRVDAELEDCSGVGLLQKVGCNARNAARSAAAEAVAAGLRQQYRGRLVRDFVGGQRIDLGLAGQPLPLQAEVLRLGARGSIVQIDAAARPGP
jgi:hypothetical protein